MAEGTEFIKIPDSSNIRAVKYDYEFEELYIRFKTSLYVYYDVPEKVFLKLLKAPSVGSFFYYNIRNVYNYELLGKYKPRGRKKMNEDVSDYDMAEAYVDYLLAGDWTNLFEILGIAPPTGINDENFDQVFDQARVLGIEYFAHHPEEIDTTKLRQQMQEDENLEEHHLDARKDKIDFIAKNDITGKYTEDYLNKVSNEGIDAIYKGVEQEKGMNEKENNFRPISNGVTTADNNYDFMEAKMGTTYGFELVKTSQPFKTYIVKDLKHGNIVLHDKEGKKVGEGQIIDATLEALGMLGSSNQIGRGKGIALQSEHLHHYNIMSISPDITISSKKDLNPSQTRPIAQAYLEFRKSQQGAAKQAKPKVTFSISKIFYWENGGSESRCERSAEAFQKRVKDYAAKLGLPIVSVEDNNDFYAVGYSIEIDITKKPELQNIDALVKLFNKRLFNGADISFGEEESYIDLDETVMENKNINKKAMIKENEYEETFDSEDQDSPIGGEKPGEELDLDHDPEAGTDVDNDIDSDVDNDIEGGGEESEEGVEIPEIVDFRHMQNTLTFSSDTPEYAALDALEENPETWDLYVDEMCEAGIEVSRDDVTDTFKVSFTSPEDEEFGTDEPVEEPASEEPVEEPADEAGAGEEDDTKDEVASYMNESVKKRHNVDAGSVKVVKDLLESKQCKLISLRGSLLESKTKGIYEVILEKRGHKYKVKYNENTTNRPWMWNGKHFQHLQECVDFLFVPVKN